eukprot:15328695-Ditylum_brightwellii.AAC.1
MKEREGTRFLISMIPTSLFLILKQPKSQTFEEYIKLLPKWGKVLLCTFTERSYDFATLDTLLRMGTLLWFVTDGGVTGPLGCFGWVLVTSTKYYGKVKGNQRGIQS